jgi:hypothetical protein
MTIVAGRGQTISILATMLASCLIGIGAAAADEPGDAELLKRLCERWDYQRTAVESAVIEYRSVRREAQPKRKPADVVALIGQGEWGTNERALRNLVPKLDVSLQGANELWCACKFTSDGTDARDDMTSVPIKSSLVHSGAYDLYSRTIGPAGGNQTDIYAPGTCHICMPSVRDFNRIPSERFCRYAVIDRSDQTVPAGRIKLRAGVEEVVVDEGTGFVFEYHLGTVNDGFYQEAYQFAPAKHGDIVLPTGIFSGRYRGGKLNGFTIWIIDNATLNQPVAPAAFTVPGKQGDIVVDRTAGLGNAEELDRNVVDILQR